MEARALRLKIIRTLIPVNNKNRRYNKNNNKGQKNLLEESI